MLESKSRLGELSAHDFIQFPAIAYQEIKEREESEPPFQPWPLTKTHCILVESCFYHDTLHVGERCGPDRKDVNNLSKIIGVEHLEANSRKKCEDNHDDQKDLHSAAG